METRNWPGSWDLAFSTDINAGADTVWAILTDLEHYGDWNRYSPRVEGTLAVGETVVIESHLGDSVQRVRNRVTRVDPEQALCWESTNWYEFLVQGKRCRYLERLDENRTRFLHREIMDGPLAWLVGKLFRERIADGMQQVNAGLKGAAERQERTKHPL